MDMFKLLTRSTTLQKSASATRNGPRQQLPSAGDTNQGATADHAHEDLRRNVPRGTKRKRVVTHEQVNIPGALDFFGKDRTSGTATSAPSRQNHENANGSNGDGEDCPHAPRSPRVHTEEECKQILKRHKLKITILNHASALPVKHSDDKASSEKAGTGHKKDVNTQVFTRPLTEFVQLREQYGISRRLAGNINAQGYKAPTEVQIASLPLLLGSDKDRGIPYRNHKKAKGSLRSDIDLLTIAPTGSGKTLAFLIPIMHELLQQRRAKRQLQEGHQLQREVQVLILAPTHELVDQIVNEGRKLAIGTGIRIAGMKKGMRLHTELQARDDQDASSNGGENGRQGTEPQVKMDSLVKAEILVSTPLLLLHAISRPSSQETVPLPSIKHIVFDEADVLLDLLFREQSLGIWKACTSPSLRTSLWSATIGSSIESLAQSFILDRRRELGLDKSSSPAHCIIRLVVGLKDSAIPNISHRLVYAASEQGKLLALRQLLHPSAVTSADSSPLQPPFLIFTQTIPRAIALYSELLYDISPEAGGSSRIAVIHSDLSETARSNIMAGFRTGEIWILITTDLLSRGVDFRGINGVVNYDIPTTGASYVHRVGRTGRQGREGGVAVTLYTKEDLPYVKNVANVIAASKKVHAAAGGKGQGTGGGVEKWLLDALPDVSKKAKKELKRKGVESRRAGAGLEDGKGASKMRISTKSGYDRRVENRRKGAVVGSQQRLAKEQDGASGSEGDDDEEWEGIGC